MPSILNVYGRCPMGCGDHLHRMPSGFLKCLAPGCPEPGAAHKILSDSRHDHHLMRVTDDGWMIMHPLRERLDEDLFSCTFAPGPADWLPPGDYRHDGNDWVSLS
jgi:hypothetical protein